MQKSNLSCWLVALIAAITLGLPTMKVEAATVSEARKKLERGEYETAISMAEQAIEAGTWSERWPRLLMEAQLITGQYDDAVATYEQAMRRYSSSLQLRMLAIEAYRHTGDSDAAATAEAQIFDLLQRSPSRYSGSENLITAGRYFAERGEDARKILELFYDRVRAREPRYLDSYIATAELALAKHDYAVAAEALETAAELAPQDPHVLQLRARAWEPSDPAQAEAALRQALEINPKHIPSLLMVADQHIDSERYGLAEETLRAVEEVNPHHPQMWAYRSVLAHLRGDEQAERDARERALESWPENPRVDYLIGKKLSQKYRFREGADAQRRALEFDPTFTEARFQLAQDLLRLGQDEAGWELAEWVNEDDAYNVVAYNLMTLRDTLQNFEILRRGNLLVRMQAREAEVYGPEVLDLLAEAERVLCEKYEVAPDGPIVVEIFPRQQDFAIRTFGLPGGDGFLGVCFGRVITANSPASQGADPSNWKSVLWHEFCHVVTLSKTNNRMPRWLSEGISVYEERQRDPTWGQAMTPTFRRMLLGQDFVPISRLSGAFLAPKSPVHLQLAYFESSLAVEFLIDRYGLETLNRILVDLGVGMPINESLQRYAGSLETLDQEFMTFVRSRARAHGCRLDWSDDDMPQQGSPEQWREWLASRPNNYWGLRGLSAALSEQGDDRAAIEPLRTIQELFGEQTVDEATTLQLAALYRELENSEAERQQLERYAAASPDGFSALTRLMELQADAGDWIQVMRTAEKTLAINPLQPIGHERLVEASEQLDRPGEAARSLEVLAMLDPVDPAKLHLRTARAWLARGEPETAKRQLLMALEEAPHYRAAQDLLLQMVADGPPGGKAASAGKMPADAEQPAETEPDTDTARKAPDAASESSDAPTEQTATDEEGRDAE